MLGKKKPAKSLEDRLRAVREAPESMHRAPTAEDSDDAAQPFAPETEPAPSATIPAVPAPPLAAGLEADFTADEPAPAHFAPNAAQPEVDPQPAEPQPAESHAPTPPSGESDLAAVAHLLWAASEGDTFLASGTTTPARRAEPSAPRFELASASVGHDTRPAAYEIAGFGRAPAASTGAGTVAAPVEEAVSSRIDSTVDAAPPPVLGFAALVDLDAGVVPDAGADSDTETAHGWAVDPESGPPVAARVEIEPEESEEESEAPDDRSLLDELTPSVRATASEASAPDDLPVSRRLGRMSGLGRRRTEHAKSKLEPTPTAPTPTAPTALSATELSTTELVETEPTTTAFTTIEPTSTAFTTTALTRSGPISADPVDTETTSSEPATIAFTTTALTAPGPVIAEPTTVEPVTPEPAPSYPTPFASTFASKVGPVVSAPAAIEPEAPVTTTAEPAPTTELVAPVTRLNVPAPVPVDDEPWGRPTDRSARFGRIGTTMIERGLITNEQLDAALEVQRTTGRRVGEILVGMDAISRFELARVLADHMGVPFVDLRAKPPDAILGALLPEEVARRYRALVIDRWNDQLVIAMANPSDLFALDDLQMVMRQPIITAMAVEEDLLASIDRVYRVSDVETTLDAAASDYVSKTDDAAPGVVEVDEGPVVRLVNALLEQAIRDHASDLHIEPASNRIAIRYRVDGVLHDSSDVPLALLRPLVSRVKILSSLDIAQNRIAQDGRFSVTVQGRPVDIRVVTVPTAAGEAVILRLLDPTRDTLHISSLGLNAAEEARFVPPFFASQGAAFIVGPTGSGKTSTVYTLLSEINTRSKSIISVEDPVEYRLDGIKQIQANPRVGLTFATTLPSILRSDPDIVFIGEVRDAETARIAADASITGHLVLSTLHATRSAAAPMRLIEMGVEPYLVASALTLVAAQRLARKLCDRCAQAVDAAEIELLRDLGADDEMLDGATVRRAVGCPGCRNSGYLGRLPILEIMPVTEPISRLILDRAPRADIERLAVDEGMETMRTAAMRRVVSGVLSVEEMMRIVS